MTPQVWAVWIVVGFAMEMVAIFDDRPNNTLSAFLVQHVPVFWISVGIVWAFVHFLTRKKGHMKADRKEG
jgi:hypothetical protein